MNVFLFLQVYLRISGKYLNTSLKSVKFNFIGIGCWKFQNEFTEKQVLLPIEPKCNFIPFRGCWLRDLRWSGSLLKLRGILEMCAGV